MISIGLAQLVEKPGALGYFLGTLAKISQWENRDLNLAFSSRPPRTLGGELAAQNEDVGSDRNRNISALIF